MSVVGSDEFRTWMAPKVAALRAFTTALNDVSERYGSQPNPESRAMGELAAEQNYRTRSTWENPITDTHTFGEMTLRAASDYLRGYGSLFDSADPPLYTHLSVARSALESAVVSAWLSEPGIGPLDRIKRGLCERLYSAKEVDDLGLVPDSAARLAEWKAVADAFGWSANVRGARPVIDGIKRPRISDGIVRLAGSEGPEVGNYLYSRLSAVTHVTWFGLHWALDIASAQSDEHSGTANVAIGTDGVQVSLVGFYVVRTVREAASERFTLMGWNDPDWLEAVRQVKALEDIFAKTVVRANSQG